ncbi:MAG: hypothetical protein HND51_01615 [Chloroflexi bacterium]|nr:hypothetical protein [Chloroflexota bacterium]
MTIQKTQRSYTWLWLLLYAFFSFFVGGRWGIPLAAWLAPVFGLRFIHQHKALRGYILLVLAAYLPIAIAWNGVTFFTFIHPAAHFLFMLVTVSLGSLTYLFYRLLIGRLEKTGRQMAFWMTLIFPVVATAMEFLVSGDSPFGTFGAQAYTQFGVSPLMQVVSITGLWGITFITAWFASVVNYVWENGFDWSQVRKGVLIFASVLVLIFGYGFARVWLAPEAETSVRVAGFNAGAAIPELMAISGDEEAFRAATQQAHAQYLERTRQAASEGAQIVVWPEGAGLGYEEDVASLLVAGQALAAEENIYLVMPVFTLYPDTERLPENMLYIADPQGELALSHTKFGGTQFEGSLPGARSLQTLETPYGTLSGAICWDADFPKVISEAGRQDVDLLIIPSNDWYELRDVHANMSIFRAVENGVSIFRQTTNGVSLAADAYGQVVNRTDQFEEGSEQLVDVPLNNTITLFPRIGDLFALIILAGFAIGSVGIWIGTRKPKTS